MSNGITAQKTRRGLTIVALAAAGLIPGGCGSDENGGDGGGTSTLSENFQAQCARCHGDTGSGGRGPSLRGFPQSKNIFQSRVRNGAGEMPAFTTTDYTDDDITADFAWLISNP